MNSTYAITQVWVLILPNTAFEPLNCILNIGILSSGLSCHFTGVFPGLTLGYSRLRSRLCSVSSDQRNGQ